MDQMTPEEANDVCREKGAVVWNGYYYLYDYHNNEMINTGEVNKNLMENDDE